MRTSHLAVLTCAAILATACGNGGGNDNFDFNESFCTEVTNCCAQAKRSGDGSSCRRTMEYKATIGIYDASAARACLAELKTQVAAGACAGRTSYVPWTCNLVYAAPLEPYDTKQPGEACDAFHLCAPSSEGEAGCACPVGEDNCRCQVRMLGKQGDSPCVGNYEDSQIDAPRVSNATDIVSRGYLCDGAKNLTCANGTCVPVSLAALGAGCVADSDCVPNAYCSTPNHVCEPKIDIGQWCKYQSGGCVDSAYCDDTTNRCVSTLATGSPCSESSMCQSGHCGDICKGYSSLLSTYCGI